MAKETQKRLADMAAERAKQDQIWTNPPAVETKLEVPSSTEVKTPPTEVSVLPPRTLTVLPRVQNLMCFANEGSSISYPAVTKDKK